MKRGQAGPALLVLAALCGCQFGGANDTSTVEMNMCNLPSDCAAGSDCVGGMCVAKAADERLTISLKVTPQRMMNGAPPLPVLLDPFPVDQPIDRTFTLPAALAVRGQVRSGEATIDADLSFTRTDGVTGIVAPTPITASVSAGTPTGDADYEVRLLQGVQYRMLIRPADTSLPPYAQTFTAGDKNVDLSVDYATLDTTDRTVVVRGAPSNRDLLVTAYDQTSGAAISSTATVSAGKAMLRFALGDAPYRLEIRAAQTYDAQMTGSTASDMPCDTDTPALPVFSIKQEDLDQDAQGNPEVTLPPQPQRIRYQGTVELCPDEASGASSVTELPITLHAQSLAFSGDTKCSAAFDTTTSAKYDPAAKALRFCVEVMPGEYDVVATPPASMRCALYAERVLIDAQGTAASGQLITLPRAAYLSGTLQAMSASPLSGASIDAVALNQSDVLDLPPGDPSLTRYNRSSQSTSNDEGSFKLAVDIGSYDIVIKPPVDSGFPWQVYDDIAVGLGARKAPISTVIDMPSPVIVNGTLQVKGGSASSQPSLAGADIDAYAIIDYDMDGKRAVSIGKSVSDDDGHFMLLLPPSTQAHW